MPTLRNVGLTPPYFHNGGQGTLAQVVQFYSRGGDSRSVHPELKVSNGANPAPGLAINGKAADIILAVAATGQTGIAAARCAKMPNDGSVDQLPITLNLLKK